VPALTFAHRNFQPGFLKRSLVIVGASLTVLTLLVALNAVPAQAAGGCAGANKSPERLAPGQLRDAALCLINHTRQQHGLGPVHSQRKLAKAATGHSRDMVNRDYFSHDSPGGGSIQTRIGGSGYLAGAHSYTFGEIIGGGSGHRGSPANVMKAWMHSAPHRSAILTGSFHDAGVGIARGFPGRGGSGATFTVDFGGRH
jgi:uncharacterized protein YkwD